MSIGPSLPLVRAARERGYAIPAFNTNGANYDITRAALEAAQATGSPVIIQEYEPNAAYRGFDYFVQQVRLLCRELNITVPVAIHLDHGHSFASVLRAMQAGFTSVMIDASHCPWAENVATTRRVLEAAHALGVTVEAEIGHVAGNEKAPAPKAGLVPAAESPPPVTGALTTPAEAEEFVRETGVDMLAVAVGSVHGVFRRQDKLNFELMKQIATAVPVPLVQHGTSGISLPDLTRLTAAGMAKVNFGEGFRYDYIRHFLEAAETEVHEWHSWKIKRAVKDRLRKTMQDIIGALGSAGRA